MTEQARKVQHRELAVVLALVVAAALGMLFTSSRTWLDLTLHREPPFGPLVKHVSGRTEFPAITGFAVVAIIAALLAVVSGRWVRRLLAALLLVISVAAGVYGVRGLSAPSDSRARDLMGSAVSQGSGTIGVSQHQLWALLTIVCAVVSLLASLGLARRAGRWAAGLSVKYDAPAEAARSADPWRSLDRGEDPTLDDR